MSRHMDGIAHLIAVEAATARDDDLVVLTLLQVLKPKGMVVIGVFHRHELKIDRAGQKDARGIVELKGHRERAFRGRVTGIKQVHPIAQEAAQALRVGCKAAARHRADKYKLGPHEARHRRIETALEDLAQLRRALRHGLERALKLGTHVIGQLNRGIDGARLDIVHEHLPPILDVAHEVEEVGDKHATDLGDRLLGHGIARMQVARVGSRLGKHGCIGTRGRGGKVLAAVTGGLA